MAKLRDILNQVKNKLAGMGGGPPPGPPLAGAPAGGAPAPQKSLVDIVWDCVKNYGGKALGAANNHKVTIAKVVVWPGAGIGTLKGIEYITNLDIHYDGAIGIATGLAAWYMHSRKPLWTRAKEGAVYTVKSLTDQHAIDKLVKDHRFPEHQARYERGHELLEDKQYDQAYKHLKKAVKLHDSDIYLLNLAHACKELDRLSEGLQAANKVLLKDPDNVDAYLAKVRLLDKKQNYSFARIAVADARRALNRSLGSGRIDRREAQVPLQEIRQWEERYSHEHFQTN